MRIDGRGIAKAIFEDLTKKIEKLKKKGVTPHLVVILVGEAPVWKAYVSQKEKKAREIGARITIVNQESGIRNQELLATIKQFNNDNNIHGIIVQRPLPPQIDKVAISLAVDPRKDIDGFHPKSKFSSPVAEAVLRILSRSHLEQGATFTQGATLTRWLKSQKIAIIGKGETGGGPIIATFKKMGLKPQVIDSRTPYPELITKSADIIISCVGKPGIIRPKMIKKGVILISVGLYKDSYGKFQGDYEEEKIRNIASFYTPIPGGVGPVNIACLLENLVKAATDRALQKFIS